MSHITPQEALRLSKADALRKKHGRGFECAAPYEADQLGMLEAVFNTAEIAALIDEAMVAKDATIKALRKEVQDAYKEADRDARDAYSQGQGDEAERHRDNY